MLVNIKNIKIYTHYQVRIKYLLFDLLVLFLFVMSYVFGSIVL